MKWNYYVMNFWGRALFYDTINNQNVAADPIECDAVLDTFVQFNKDSFFYTFSFVKKDMRFRYVDGLLYGSGIKFKNGYMYPLFHMIEDESNMDSLKKYWKDHDEWFRYALRKHKGTMSRWLKDEAIRRKVL